MRKKVTLIKIIIFIIINWIKQSENQPLNSTIFKNSTILTNEQSLLLCNLTNIPSNKVWPLLYQASRDGFKVSNFHSKVDGIQGTLTIIKTVDSFIFGGYTQVEWNYTRYYGYDDSSFIFSLNNSYNKPVKMNVKPNFYSIYTSSNYGPTFGNGHDFFISDQSNLIASSYSNIYSYELPNFASSTSLLAGSYNFKTFEIEVYAVLVDCNFKIYFKFY